LAKHFKSVLDCQNTFESVLDCQSTFEIYLLGLFICIGEKLFQRYIQKSFLVIGDYKTKWNSTKIIFLVRPQYCPSFFSQSSVLLKQSHSQFVFVIHYQKNVACDLILGSHKHFLRGLEAPFLLTGFRPMWVTFLCKFYIWLPTKNAVFHTKMRISLNCTPSLLLHQTNPHPICIVICVHPVPGKHWFVRSCVRSARLIPWVMCSIMIPTTYFGAKSAVVEATSTVVEHTTTPQTPHPQHEPPLSYPQKGLCHLSQRHQLPWPEILVPLMYKFPGRNSKSRSS